MSKNRVPEIDFDHFDLDHHDHICTLLTNTIILKIFLRFFRKSVGITNIIATFVAEIPNGAIMMRIENKKNVNVRFEILIGAKTRARLTMASLA